MKWLLVVVALVAAVLVALKFRGGKNSPGTMAGALGSTAEPSQYERTYHYFPQSPEAAGHLVQQLQSASKSGEIVPVVYFGGSHQGEVRDIYPIKVTDREVSARDIETDTVKTYLIERMRSMDDVVGATLGTPSGATSATAPEIADLTIGEAFADRVADYEAMGWYVTLEQNGVGLHMYFKNGKPHKSANVRLEKYEDSPNRPYYLAAPSLATARTFGKLSSAIKLFEEKAIEHAPEN